MRLWQQGPPQAVCPGAHLGAEVLEYIPEDVRLHLGQHQLPGGLGRHVAVTQDQGALQLFDLVLASVLRGQRGWQGLSQRSLHAPQQEALRSDSPSPSGRRAEPVSNVRGITEVVDGAT